MIHDLRKLEFSKYALLVAIITFIFIIVRAVAVPITHDEAATFLHYIQRGEFFPYYAHWDANNHPLNSFLSIIMYKAIGDELIWLRMPNALSFLLYAVYAFKLLRGLSSKLAQSLGYLALLTAWMPFEFFSQCRGYGLSLAFLLPSIFYLWRFLTGGAAKDQIALWVFLILTLSANLSLSNTYLMALFLVLASIILWHRGSRISTLSPFFLLGIPPFIAFAIVSFEMKGRGLLYYGEDTGFLAVTVKTLALYSFGENSALTIVIVVLIGVLSSLFLLIDKGLLNPMEFSKGHLCAILLLGNVAGAFALNAMFGVNFPEDRVGIYFIPLFILVVLYASEKLKALSMSMAHVASALSLLAFPVCTLANSSFSSTNLWKSIALDRSLYEKIKAERYSFNRPIIISGYKLFPLSWAYENLKSEKPLPPMGDRENDELISDFHICYAKDCGQLLDFYEDAYPENEGDIRVFKRRELLMFGLVKEYQTANLSSKREFYNLFDEFDQNFVQQSIAIEIGFDFKTEMNPALINLIISVQDNEGETSYYDSMPLHWIRHNWDGNRLELIRPVKFSPNDTRLTCYLWNRKKQEYEVSNISTRLLKLANVQ